jgi:hypothetical protein
MESVASGLVAAITLPVQMEVSSRRVPATVIPVQTDISSFASASAGPTVVYVSDVASILVGNTEYPQGRPLEAFTADMQTAFSILLPRGLLYPTQVSALLELLKRHYYGSTIGPGNRVIHSRLTVLGNGVGTGKTYTTVAFLLVVQKLHLHAQPSPDVMQLDIEPVNPYIKKQLDPFQLNQIYLIVVGNANLADQWVKACAKLGLTYYLCDSTASAQRVVGSTGVFIARGRGLQELLLLKSNTIFSMLVQDEPDTQKNPMLTTKNMKPDRILFVTATYQNLLPARYPGNGYGHASITRTVMQNVGEETLQALVVKTANSPADMGIDPPLIVNERIVCKRPILMDIIGGTDPQLTQMIENGDWGAVDDTIGEAKGAQKVVDALLHLLDFKIANAAARVKPDELYIRDLYANRRTILRRYENLKQNPEACPICLEDPIDNPTVTECLHACCHRCIVQWLINNSPTCPLCRANVDIKKLVQPKTSSKEEKKSCTPPDKITAIKEILIRHDMKGVVYGATQGSLDWMKEQLLGHGITSGGLEGHGSTRKRTFDEFVNGDTAQVLLLNSTKQAAGLDGLQRRCNCVIFYHDSGDRAYRDQIVGRLARPGQVHDTVHVYTLAY